MLHSMEKGEVETKTIILPGYSKHNREWAEDIKSQMNLHYSVVVHEWMHWANGGFNLARELKQIKKEIGSDSVNIIAKSVGVFVTLNLMEQIASQVNKVIL